MRPEGAARTREGIARTRPSLAAVQGALLSLVTGRAADEAVVIEDELVAGDARASAAERVAVYNHMYRARLAEALASQFPRLAASLGPCAFEALAARYAEAHPSRHPSLRFLGRHLSSWLEATGESSSLVGMAHLEWARADVFDLADEEVLTVEAARAWPAERFGELPLRLVEAHRMVTIARGTVDWWDALTTDAQAVPVAAPGEREPVIVWREGTGVYHRPLDPEERRALELAAAGTSFAQICESLLDHHDEAAAATKAYAWLCTWLADGMLQAG